jgi:hypothetical protein
MAPPRPCVPPSRPSTAHQNSSALAIADVPVGELPWGVAVR